MTTIGSDENNKSHAMVSPKNEEAVSAVLGKETGTGASSQTMNVDMDMHEDRDTGVVAMDPSSSDNRSLIELNPLHSLQEQEGVQGIAVAYPEDRLPQELVHAEREEPHVEVQKPSLQELILRAFEPNEAIHQSNAPDAAQRHFLNNIIHEEAEIGLNLMDILDEALAMLQEDELEGLAMLEEDEPEQELEFFAPSSFQQQLHHQR